MQTLSYTQEYFLCALNGKRNLNSTDIACLLAGGIAELRANGYFIRAEKDKLVAGKAWDDALPYLASLYERIVGLKRPQTAGEIAINYSGKETKQLHAALGASLVAAGCADEASKKGLFREKTVYVPSEQAVKRAVYKIRAAFLEDGAMADGQEVYLAALLESGGLIRNYFSKFEADTMKQRIKDLCKSEAYASIRETLDEFEQYIAAIVVIIAA
jgi:hypothetical protein